MLLRKWYLFWARFWITKINTTDLVSDPMELAVEKGGKGRQTVITTIQDQGTCRDTNTNLEEGGSGGQRDGLGDNLLKTSQPRANLLATDFPMAQSPSA